jgi:ABC transport system ATP-binding/permease protein
VVNSVVNFLQAEQISKSIGDLILFENISLSIDQDQKIGLLARNGAGKTSLLRILAGEDTPDIGKITSKTGLTIGYLKQDPLFNEDHTVIEEVLSSAGEITETIREYEIVIHSDNRERLAMLTERMDALGAWDYDTRVKQILSKLDITDFNVKIRFLSGGQRKRVALAKVLITEPDLLILDEPTNHLDLEMIEWLERFLLSIRSSLLMVTHDRYFLDRVCNEILELDEKQLYTYKGNYGYFLEKREMRIQQFNAQVDRARNLLRTEIEWMRRMPQARGTKSKSRVEAFYGIQEVASQKTKDKKVNLNVKMTRLGTKILELEYISKSYDRVLIRDFHYKFVRGEKIGVIGNNGCGKTTLLELITRKIKPDQGKIDIGETVRYGYYRQEGMKLDENARIIDVVRDIAELVVLGDGSKMGVAQFLNYFLFPPETHYFHVSKLSGGEKRRLYLLTVLMQNPNFLILDEPTNDLDIITLNVLEEYLQKYSGCLLIVSHDRFFMDKIVDHLFVFESAGSIRDFPGNYSQYRIFRDEQEKKRKPVIDNTSRELLKEPSKTPLKVSYKDKREFELLTSELQVLNDRKSDIDRELNRGNNDPERLFELTVELASLLGEIDKMETRWLELDELMNG